MIPGSRASERFLFRVPAGRLDRQGSHGSEETYFQESLITDFRQTQPDHSNKAWSAPPCFLAW